MVYNFTNYAKVAIKNASVIAMRYSDMINTEHILYGLSTVVDTPASKLLASYSITSQSLEQLFSGYGSVPSRGDIEYSPRTKDLIMLASSISQRLGQTHITTEHLLLSTISIADSYASKILGDIYKIDITEIRDKTLKIVSPTKVNRYQDFVSIGNKKTSTSLPEELLDMGNDITQRARDGKIDPIIGRQDEIERVIEILCRKTKNNPVIIGEAGVGKSAIIEGLATKIANGDVPAILRDKTIYSMDIGGLMAGTKYRGSMEEKLKNVIEIIKNNGNIIIFIDEIHTLAAVGGEKGEINPADMLKPYLARGELQTIGATTTDEYRRYIEKDKALERRFQPITINAPNIEQTISILKGLRNSYEEFHKVSISDEAIIAAVNMADKYIVDRSFPDKAIDLIDEAASRAKVMSNYSNIEDYDAQNHMQQLNNARETAVENEDYNYASELKQQIQRISSTLKGNEKVAIDTDDIAQVVSKWTGVPITRLSESEADKLLKLEDVLGNRVIGQNNAIELVARAIRRSRIGIRDSKKPIGSFLFLGSTGVGKTELCKALADALYDNENNIIRLDMSEYMDSHSTSKIIGAPPGYVGFDDGGQLTELIKRKPYSIVLFDEVEKAHKDVMNILLQILDDGRLTDTHGNVVSFKNAIIIMTSNIGSNKFYNNNIGFNNDTMDNDIILSELKNYFRAEFINRIDNIVVFNRLSKIDMKEITKNMLVNLSKMLKDKNIAIKVTDEALEYLVNKGSNAEYGARPMKRLITSEIEDRLADMLLKGEINNGDIVILDSNGYSLSLKKD